MSEDNYPRARVIEVDGKLVLEDPDAVAMIKAIAKFNCKQTALGQKDRIIHFIKRIAELKRSPKEVMITLINVDSLWGNTLADMRMPGHDWQTYRDRGEIPFARGLAGREGLQLVAYRLDTEVGLKLQKIPGIAILVVDHGVIEVFTPGELMLDP